MSFDIALSGIQAINEQLDTVSNNIANSSTYGFKSGRANFASVYAGAQANGVEVGSITQNIGKSGSTTTTGRALDAAINGSGFFISRDPQGGMTYSRVGIFSTDVQGFLIDSNGKKVQGYGKSTTGGLGVLGDIQVPTGQIPAQPTGKVTLIGNMSADWQVPATTFDPTDSSTFNTVKQSIAYDSLGTQHTISQYFVKTGTGTVKVYYGVDNGAVSATPGATLSFGSDGQLSGTATASVTVPSSGGGTGTTVGIDYTGTTMFAGDATTSTNRSDGYASGAFVGVTLSDDGSVVAKYTNNESQVVGTIAIANFADQDALTPVSDTSWAANADSGVALLNPPGAGMAGKLVTSSLEGSNVDVTSELVGLMTSQRNYQANSKVLSTESQMMQSLMQAM